MRRAARYLSWMAAFIMCAAWLGSVDEMKSFAFQKDRTFRNVSGLVVMGIILFQWGLTLGRTIFQRTGSRWGSWIKWHLRSAIILPFAVLAHSIALGWGLLALLPLSIMAAAHFGSHLDGDHSIRQGLKFHIGFSALTLALALVHAWTVLVFN